MWNCASAAQRCTVSWQRSSCCSLDATDRISVGEARSLAHRALMFWSHLSRSLTSLFNLQLPFCILFIYLFTFYVSNFFYLGACQSDLSDLMSTFVPVKSTLNEWMNKWRQGWLGVLSARRIKPLIHPFINPYAAHVEPPALRNERKWLVFRFVSHIHSVYCNYFIQAKDWRSVRVCSQQAARHTPLALPADRMMVQLLLCVKITRYISLSNKHGAWSCGWEPVAGTLN